MSGYRELEQSLLDALGVEGAQTMSIDLHFAAQEVPVVRIKQRFAADIDSSDEVHNFLTKVKTCILLPMDDLHQRFEEALGEDMAMKVMEVIRNWNIESLHPKRHSMEDE